jgi:hypothetical protein
VPPDVARDVHRRLLKDQHPVDVWTSEPVSRVPSNAYFSEWSL